MSTLHSGHPVTTNNGAPPVAFRGFDGGAELTVARQIDAELTVLLGRLKRLDPNWKLTSRIEQGQSLWRFESRNESRILTFEDGELSYAAPGGRYERIALTQQANSALPAFLDRLGQLLQPGLPPAVVTPQVAKPTVRCFTVPKIFDSDFGRFVKQLDRAITEAGGGIKRELDRRNGQSYDWWGYADYFITLTGPSAGVEEVERAMLTRGAYR